MFATRPSLSLMVMVLVMSGSAIPAGKKTMNIFDIFKWVDRNNDGHLTKKEVQEDQLKNLETPEARAFLEKMDATEYQLKKVGTEMADKFFDAADGDKDGKITKKEADLLNEKLRGKLESIGKKINVVKDFKKVDKDGDDHLTIEELKDFYKDDLVAWFAENSIVKKPDPKVSQYHATKSKLFIVRIHLSFVLDAS